MNGPDAKGVKYSLRQQDVQRRSLTADRDESEKPMPLPYATLTPLSVDAGRFNADGVLPLYLHGLRRGDVWTFTLYPDGDPAIALKNPLGSLTASIADAPDRDFGEFRASPEYRKKALESALFWLITETRQHRWRLAYMKEDNEYTREQDLPNVIIAQTVLVNEHFELMPEQVLLDEVITGTAPA